MNTESCRQVFLSPFDLSVSRTLGVSESIRRANAPCSSGAIQNGCCALCRRGSSRRSACPYGKDGPSSAVFPGPADTRSFYQFPSLPPHSAAKVTNVRLSEVKPSDHEVDVFKALHRAPGALTSHGVVLGKRAQLPKHMVKVSEHRVLGPVYHDLMSTFRKLNGHGAARDKEAFGVGSHPQTNADPPSRHDVNSRELGRKKKVTPANGHHGATPAVSYGVGTPRTTAVTDPKRAPPHASYFHEPQHQPTMPTTAAHGKADGASDLIKQAFSRPYGSPEEI
jgi:hypothetical protein